MTVEYHNVQLQEKLELLQKLTVNGSLISTTPMLGSCPMSSTSLVNALLQSIHLVGDFWHIVNAMDYTCKLRQSF